MWETRPWHSGRVMLWIKLSDTITQSEADKYKYPACLRLQMCLYEYECCMHKQRGEQTVWQHNGISGCRMGKFSKYYFKKLWSHTVAPKEHTQIWIYSFHYLIGERSWKWRREVGHACLHTLPRQKWNKCIFYINTHFSETFSFNNSFTALA